MRHRYHGRMDSNRIGFMRTSILCSMALVLLATACGAGESLSPDEKPWCLGNADRVESAARDLGLLGFIGVYC